MQRRARHLVTLLPLVILKAGYVPNETVTLGTMCWLLLLDFRITRYRHTEEVIASINGRECKETLVLLDTTYKK